MVKSVDHSIKRLNVYPLHPVPGVHLKGHRLNACGTSHVGMMFCKAIFKS